MKIFSRGDIGFVVEDNGSMGSLWISDERASRPLKGFALDFQMWFIHLENSGKALPTKDICELATTTGIELMEESGAFRLVKNTPAPGGYLLVVDHQKMMAYIDSRATSPHRAADAREKKRWWQVWR